MGARVPHLVEVVVLVTKTVEINAVDGNEAYDIAMRQGVYAVNRAAPKHIDDTEAYERME